jgi:hypothetical protein
LAASTARRSSRSARKRLLMIRLMGLGVAVRPENRFSWVKKDFGICPRSGIELHFTPDFPDGMAVSAWRSALQAPPIVRDGQGFSLTWICGFWILVERGGPMSSVGASTSRDRSAASRKQNLGRVARCQRRTKPPTC